ncbi:2-oxo acid dehydrogenase subunit E2 [Isoptericola sediminis]|uniref:Dehydrogenase n=1 Tax=Isoptericola sediminis TaxID=2733572 RepID=A0A849JYB8_9MICO|nr:2-oxo acid dehydrogenase subunit E2 [Isoptericola sediminis]NNU28296.1 dehydrogenase [Isoptericola sediminis]
MRSHDNPEQRGYSIQRFPPVRRAYVDVLQAGHRQHTIHGLVEVDVDRALDIIHRSPDVSVTGWIIACVATAVGEDPGLQAHRWGSRRLVLFDDVDVNVQLDQTLDDGTRVVQSRIIRAAQSRTAQGVTREIRAARHGGEVDRRRLRGTLLFARLPRVLRTPLWRAVFRRPSWSKKLGGTIAVSSVGMFGRSLGWGIPIAPAPLMVTVGGIGPRPVLTDGELVNRRHVSLTVSLDHDVVDGAPAAQFVDRLTHLLDEAHGLVDPDGS